MMIEFPYQPPEEYDFNIEFTYSSGGQVNQFLRKKAVAFLG